MPRHFRLMRAFSLLAPICSLTASLTASLAAETKVDAATAEVVYPYWVMSSNAYGEASEPSVTSAGVRRLSFGWEPVLSRAGYSPQDIDQLRNSGFDAALYRNDSTKEITIAFRGSDQTKDFLNTNIPARIRLFDLQYKAAADLMSATKQVWPKGTIISATGDSLGGGLASYAAAKNPDITKVITFSAARNAYSTSGNNPSQINIYVRGDVIGDPNNSTAYGRIAGSGTLPGKSFYVDSTTQTLVRDPWLNRNVPELLSSHDLRGVGGGLEAVRKNSTVPPPAVTNWQRPSATFSNGLTLTVARTYGSPGGISLTKAAAERVPLNINLDGSYHKDGRIVLSGKDNATSSFDAALLMTSLRLACETSDPYFSLDPDDGALWGRQGEDAYSAAWDRIRTDFNVNPTPPRRDAIESDVSVRTVSARRDYPILWRELAPRYPNFRSRLVFSPEWLRGTRFGEALYIADVLLKELSSGVSVLRPGPLRARSIKGYLAADVERAAKGLLGKSADQRFSQRQWSGSRLWFDIAPPSTIVTATAGVQPPVGDQRLLSILRSRGLLRTTETSLQQTQLVIRDQNALDLSFLNPRMLVRKHDHSTRQDLLDNDPDLDGLAADVSIRMDQYSEAYNELKLLKDVFRSYVLAVHVVASNDHLCDSMRELPLLDSERIDSPLPEYHPSELFITVVSYKTVTQSRDKIISQAFASIASSVNGGVSIGGKRFLQEGFRGAQTAITSEINRRVASDELSSRNGRESNRLLVAFALDEPLLVPLHSSSASRGALAPPPNMNSVESDDIEIENAPPPATLPPRTRWWFSR